MTLAISVSELCDAVMYLMSSRRYVLGVLVPWCLSALVSWCLPGSCCLASRED
jgi:hypothetical protein